LGNCKSPTIEEETIGEKGPTKRMARESWSSSLKGILVNAFAKKKIDGSKVASGEENLKAIMKKIY